MSDGGFPELEITTEPLLFPNPSGLVIFRRVPDDTTTAEVDLHGLVIFTGLEATPSSLESGYAHYVAPEGSLPVYISPLSITEFTKQVITGEGRFISDRGGKIIVTEIPWDMLTNEDIALYMNTSTLRTFSSGEDTVRLLPMSVNGGHVLQTEISGKLQPSLTSALTSRGQLHTTAREFLIATPSQQVFDIANILHSTSSLFLRSHTPGTAGQILHTTNAQ